MIHGIVGDVADESHRDNDMESWIRICIISTGDEFVIESRV